MPRSSYRRQVHASLLTRMPSTQTGPFERLHSALHRTKDILDELDDKADALASSRAYTPEGLRERLNAFAASAGITSALQAHRAAVEAAKAHLANKRAEISRKPVDPSNVVAEMQRAELRAYLRGLPAHERIQVALEKNPAVMDAILSAAPVLSGLAEETYQTVLNAIVEAEHGPVLKELAQLEEAIDVAGVAVTMTETEIGELLGGPGAVAPSQAA